MYILIKTLIIPLFKFLVKVYCNIINHFFVIIFLNSLTLSFVGMLGIAPYLVTHKNAARFAIYMH